MVQQCPSPRLDTALVTDIFNAASAKPTKPQFNYKLDYTALKVQSTLASAHALIGGIRAVASLELLSVQLYIATIHS